MKLTVHIDTSEQVPLLFPRVLVVRPRRAYSKAMRTVLVTTEQVSLKRWGADYAVAGHYEASMVERKRGMRELYKNVWTSDFGRFGKSLDRLAASCRHPYLVLEGSVAELYRDDKLHPGDVLSHLLRELQRRGIGFHAAGRAESTRTRRQLGDFVLRLMLGHTGLLGTR